MSYLHSYWYMRVLPRNFVLVTTKSNLKGVNLSQTLATQTEFVLRLLKESSKDLVAVPRSSMYWKHWYATVNGERFLRKKNWSFSNCVSVVPLNEKRQIVISNQGTVPDQTKSLSCATHSTLHYSLVLAKKNFLLATGAMRFAGLVMGMLSLSKTLPARKTFFSKIHQWSQLIWLILNGENWRKVFGIGV